MALAIDVIMAIAMFVSGVQLFVLSWKVVEGRGISCSVAVALLVGFFVSVDCCVLGQVSSCNVRSRAAANSVRQLIFFSTAHSKSLFRK